MRPLCATCHPEVEAELVAENAHQPAAEPEGCTTCHGPHVTRNANLLLEPVAETCQQCHDGGSAEFAAQHLGLPADTLDCGSCHDPHASQLAGMLLPKVHEPFASGDCTMCHGETPAQGGGER
jgi:predicted CXXCH cytochrome family protein